MTGMGSRTLKRWLLEPRRDRLDAQQRLGAIGALSQGHAWEDLRAQLKGSADVERITARIALRQARPRELVGLMQTLSKNELLAHIPRGLDAYLTHISGDLQPPRWLRPAAARGHPARARRCWCATAVSSPPVLMPSSTSCAPSPTNCDSFLLDLEQRERARSGIANLQGAVQQGARLLHRSHQQGQVDKVPEDYRRRQTLKNAERFITPELKALRTRHCRPRSVRWRARNGCTSRCWTSCRTLCRCSPRFARALAALDACVRPDRARAHPELGRAAVCERAVHRHHPRPPPGGGSTPGFGRQGGPSGSNGNFIANDTRLSMPSSACRSSPGPTWAVNRPICARLP